MNEQELKFMETVKTEVKGLIDESQKGLISKEALDSRIQDLSAKLDEIKGASDEVRTLKSGIENMSKEMELLKNFNSKVSNDPTKEVGEFVESLKESAEALRNKKSGFVHVKTLSSMTFLDNVTGQIPQAVREAGITPLVRQRFVIREAANVFPIAGNYAEWTEQRNSVGSAAATSEASAKSMVEWDYVVSGTKVEKITAYIKISNEMLKDIPGMIQEINSNLTYKVNLAEEGYFFTGTGTSPQIKGLDVYAGEIDLAALAGSILHPNKIDILIGAATQIEVNGKGELMANRIYLNPVDKYKLICDIKSSTLEYVNNGMVQLMQSVGNVPQLYIMGIPVVTSLNVTAGYFYVCDMSRYNIRDNQALSIEMGYDSDDFTKNLVTIRAEKYLATYAKANHGEGFIKDTFANALTFIETGS